MQSFCHLDPTGDEYMGRDGREAASPTGLLGPTGSKRKIEITGENPEMRAGMNTPDFAPGAKGG